MVNYRINNMKIFNPTINKIVKAGRYDTEDITECERKFIMKNTTNIVRVARVDLVPGNLVVVLEGENMGKRVVFVKQLQDNKALVSGVTSLNGVGLFKIDERYLFKLETSIEIPVRADFNIENIHESKINEAEKMDVEPSKEEVEFEKSLLKSIFKVPFMKSYIAEPFKVDPNVEFYSQNY